MIVYRITRTEYKDHLSGEGAYLYGGRWNSKGRHVLYCAASISLAVLELVVNFSRSASPIKLSYHLLEIDIPDNSIQEILLSKLQRDWITNEEHTRFIGDNFIENNNLLSLKVASAVIPEEFNFVINPAHEMFKKVKIKSSKPFGFDQRLLN